MPQCWRMERAACQDQRNRKSQSRAGFQVLVFEANRGFISSNNFRDPSNQHATGEHENARKPNGLHVTSTRVPAAVRTGPNLARAAAWK